MAADEFDGGELDTSRWGTFQGVPGCCQATLWDPSMVQVRGGTLHLMNKPDSTGRWLSGGVGSWRWAGAGVLRYGRVDARLRFDAGVGISAAALLWPDKNASWPPELDFYEIGREIGDRSVAMISNHWLEPTNNSAAPTHRVRQAWAHQDFTAWHEVSTRWSPELLVVLIDGVEVFRETDPERISDLPMWIGFQTHVEPVQQGPTLPAGTDSIDLEVDWVRIYRPAQ